MQEETDKLEQHGVLAKPEDINDNVEYTYHQASSLKNLQEAIDLLQHSITSDNMQRYFLLFPPLVIQSCAQTFQMEVQYIYLSFFQISVAKSSMKYLGTVTSFKGLQVYTCSTMGMPDSSEHLQELPYFWGFASARLHHHNC